MPTLEELRLLTHEAMIDYVRINITLSNMGPTERAAVAMAALVTGAYLILKTDEL